MFDFSAKGRAKSKTESTDKVAASTPPAVTEAPVPAIVPPVLPEPVLHEEKRFIGELEVMVEDGQLICPVPECRKHFRKENLLHVGSHKT